ncbi:Putative disease resistance protein RGA3 [Linum grandiflorum]
MKLRDTVLTIKAVLLDAEEKQNHNRQVKVWLEKLSDVLYDADDLLDDFSTEARQQAMDAAENDRRRRTTACLSSVRFRFPSFLKQLSYGFKMAADIKAVREKLDAVKNERAFHLDELTEEALPPSRETDSCPPLIVVGREDDKNNIVQMLLNGNIEANISIVPIVGMGGMGKTTLAQLVFDDKHVQDFFAVKVWVYVSQTFDIKVILEKMLKSITRESRTSLELEVLQAQLREKINGKRFLFVLDDVWEENVQSWENFGKFLAVGSPGSKVLVTTRSSEVAKVGGVVLPYSLRGLSPMESLNLFAKKAFNGRLSQNSFLEKIGREILRKCHGVPLAISTISGLLRCKNSEIEWQLFLENVQKSISTEDSDIMSTLKLSYNHLLPHMKRCFAYCKLFPKGHMIDVPSLVQFWVSQRYVESEDDGVDCFKRLWWRSFFQEVEMDEFGNISTCKMHDMMHDLVESITREKILRISSLSDMKNIACRTRHLTLLNEGNRDQSGRKPVELGNVSKVRTLICVNFFSREEFARVIHNFKRLRVLVMLAEGLEDSDASTQQLHCSVSKLKHLRFLYFGCEGMERLPDSVTKLLNLQVIGVASNSFKELPKDIVKLVDLKHLYIRHNISMAYVEHFARMPKGIGELKSLQTLPVIVVDKRTDFKIETSSSWTELKGLNALRGQLIIRNLANVEFQRDGTVCLLNGKVLLQSLILDWGHTNDNDEEEEEEVVVTPTSAHDEDILEMLCPHPNLKQLEIRDGYAGSKLPDWLSSITNLVEISLEDCRKCEYLPSLHHLPCLKKLKFSDCPRLKGIRYNNESSPSQQDDQDVPSFHCLAYLYITDCLKLTRMPTFPTVEGDFELIRGSLQPLARTMKMMIGRKESVLCPSSSPLSKLTKLTLQETDDDLGLLPDGYDDSSGLVSLQELFLKDCCRGVKVPSSLCCSTSLTAIHIYRCEMVMYLLPLHVLPSLRQLKLEDCPKLKGCWHEKEDQEDWPQFPCLLSLKLSACPNLTRLPLFPTVEGDLQLWRVSARVVCPTMKMKSTSTLSRLTHLTIWDIVDLESLPEEGLCNLTSLTELVIVSCPKLASLPPAMRYLTSLRTLVMLSCPHLTERCRKGEGEDWPNISHIPKIVLDREILQDSGGSEASVLDDPLIYRDSEMMKNTWKRSTSLNFNV